MIIISKIDLNHDIVFRGRFKSRFSFCGKDQFIDRYIDSLDRCIDPKIDASIYRIGITYVVGPYCRTVRSTICQQVLKNMVKKIEIHIFLFCLNVDTKNWHEGAYNILTNAHKMFGNLLSRYYLYVLSRYYNGIV
jgi:hypothetical protein